jgi:ABC-type oligopeptide transport system substrate-binding subunit
LIGAPKHGPDYTHFDWVDPNAPKGGRVRRWAMGTFDSLNQFPSKAHAAIGLRLIYDTLLMQSPDEAGASYGLIAEWVTYPEDYSSATVQLRDGARFHDGKPITPDDVIFSFDDHQESLSQPRLLLQGHRKGGEDRRSPGHLHLLGQGQPRAADHHRRPAGAAEAFP